VHALLPISTACIDDTHSFALTTSGLMRLPRPAVRVGPWHWRPTLTRCLPANGGYFRGVPRSTLLSVPDKWMPGRPHEAMTCWWMVLVGGHYSEGPSIRLFNIMQYLRANWRGSGMSANNTCDSDAWLGGPLLTCKLWSGPSRKGK
jgi:hypothetical protein